MNCKLLVALAAGAFVAASSTVGIGQGLSPSGGQSGATFHPSQPFADLNIDHTKTHDTSAWSHQQRAEVKRRCDHIAANKVDYEEQIHGFCTTHSSDN